uniref:Selenocysteine lyase n=1 Tax=Caenorhabditis tropicalis TaxID=1561998 RepID=A0A1I7TTF6_9PELO
MSSDISRIYLDNNATTPLDDRVKNSISEALNLWANPSSNNENATKAAEAIAEARNHLARMFNVENDGVVFTSGGTESNNWVIEGAIQTARKLNRNEIPHVITTNIEHPSILEPLKRREEFGEITVTYVSVNPLTGFVTSQSVNDSLTPSTCLITIMLANNETGVLQPVEEICHLIRDKLKEKSPFLHSDVAQAAGKIPIDVKSLGVDAVTVVGHKFYGPRNGALIFSPRGIRIPPMLLGGNQESGWRSGTENTPMIVGLGEAARIYNEGYTNIESVLRQNRDYFEELLVKKNLRNSHVIHFLGSPRLPNTSSVAFLDYPSHGCDLLEKCRTFYASTGAACHKNECSPILKACGIPFAIASKTVRISFGRSTTLAQIDTVVEELEKLCSPLTENDF